MDEVIGLSILCQEQKNQALVVLWVLGFLGC